VQFGLGQLGNEGIKIGHGLAFTSGRERYTSQRLGGAVVLGKIIINKSELGL
jgi:hypothetical protein